MARTNRFEARFDGECDECCNDIFEGDPVGYIRGQSGIRCDVCLSHAEEWEE